MSMDTNNYLDQIRTDLNYFHYIHHTYPQTIFISYRLYCMVQKDIIYHYDGEETCFGVPVKMYSSEKLEYHFAVSKYEFEITAQN